jgi:hypothetical protein
VVKFIYQLEKWHENPTRTLEQDGQCDHRDRRSLRHLRYGEVRMIFLNRVKWKHSLERLFEDHSPDSVSPETDKRFIRKLVKAYGQVYCTHDPFEDEINGKRVLLFAPTEAEVEHLAFLASQEI